MYVKTYFMIMGLRSNFVISVCIHYIFYLMRFNSRDWLVWVELEK